MAGTSYGCDPSTIEKLAERTIPICFEEAAARIRDSSALSYRSDALSYNDLNRAANRLAHAILQKTGSSRQPVVLMMAQEASAVVGLLAIMKAGKICVPVNPANNEARVIGSSWPRSKTHSVFTRMCATQPSLYGRTKRAKRSSARMSYHGTTPHHPRWI